MRVSESLVPRRAGAAGYGWAAVGLLVLTVYGALLPFHLTPRPLSEAVESFRHIPSFDPSDLTARGDWVVSLVQYAALGFLLMAAACADSTWADAPVAAVVAPVCAALAIALEFTQQFFPPRTVSWNDIAVECTGAAAGVAAWLASGRRVARWARRLTTVTTVSDLARRLMPAYLAALLIVELMPFDFVVGGAELAVKHSEGRVQLTPFSGPFDAKAARKAIFNVVAFLPMGMLPVLAGMQFGSSVDRPRRPGLALAGPVLVEVLQLFVYSRVFEATDILTGMAGVCGGWWLGRPRLVRRLVEWMAAPQLGPIGAAAWLTWLAAVVYVHWHPFDFSIDPSSFAIDSDELAVYGLRRMTFAPFVDYYWGSKYNALDQFVRKGISFLPVGVLVALSVPQVFQQGAGRRTVATALVIAVVLQIGRFFLPSHMPSVTDVLIECVAAWLGFRFTQYVRSVLWAETVFTTFTKAPRSAPDLQFITPWRDAGQVRRSGG
jgi:VanZ family protein